MSNMDKIIIADDAEMNRKMLQTIFSEQYETIEACDGLETIAKLKENPDIVALFLDLMMPGKNGLEVLHYMEDENLLDRIPVIMITGEATKETDLKAYEYGAADIIYKPFEPDVVMRRTMNLVELYQHRQNIEAKLAEKNAELIESQKKLAENNTFLINALGSVVEFRSAESGTHVQRVSEYTRILLKHVRILYPEYGLTKPQIEMIAQAAALHDVGKIAIPDEILKKPGKLTKDEFNQMKSHTIYGCEILEKFKQEDSEFYKYCYEICRWHHEKYDGKGYPDGLVGEEIPIWAQAASVADCFDALSSERCYKIAYAPEQAFEMICAGECGVFGEKIIEAFKAAQFEMFKMADK